MGIWYLTGILKSLFKRIWAITWDFQQCGMCDQQRLRSACAYAQSDKSLSKSLKYSMTVKLLTEKQLKRRLHRLVWVYACQNATLFEITCGGSIMLTYRVGLEVFNYNHTLCMRAKKALVSLHVCTGSPESSVFDNAISTKCHTVFFYN